MLFLCILKILLLEIVLAVCIFICGLYLSMQCNTFSFSIVSPFFFQISLSSEMPCRIFAGINAHVAFICLPFNLDNSYLRAGLIKQRLLSLSQQSGGTPQVVGSIPGRDEFPPAGKKTPRLPYVQSTMEPGLTHKATGPRVRVGQEFGGFLSLL